jgi:hypothetical protein
MKSNTLKLVEDKVNMTVDLLRHGNQRISLYKIDELPKSLKRNKQRMFPFLNYETKNVTALCDYVIFVSENEKNYALLAELKSGNDRTLTQLDAGECLVKYVIDTANRVNDYHHEVIIRKISIHSKKLKGRTKIKPIIYDENNRAYADCSTLNLKRYLY